MPDYEARDCFPKFRLVSQEYTPQPGSCEGDPCDPLSGNVLLSETDIPGSQGMAFTRRYQSMGFGEGGDSLGVNWIHPFGARLQAIPDTLKVDHFSVASSPSYDSPEEACKYGWRKIADKAYNGKLRHSSAHYNNGACEIGGATAKVILPVLPDRPLKDLNHTYSTQLLIRPNGERYLFRLVENGQWESIEGRPVTLTKDAQSWLLTFADGAAESYGLDGLIRKATGADGRQTTYRYDADKQLKTVTNPYGQHIEFTYTDGKISRAEAPGGSADYAYDDYGNLVRVTYPDETTRQYRYENADFPHLLTGVIDEKGVRIATWSYNSKGRVVINERAENTEHYTFAYDRYRTTTVTDSAGAQRTYHYDVFNGKLRFTEITGDRCDNCGHRDDQKRSYNDQGHILSRTDWNGVTTTYERDASGLELSRTEAAGTPQARTITTEWHPEFRKPLRVSEPDRLIEYTYDSAGRLQSKTERALPQPEK
jgi:YD repeat-containing protein